MYCDIPHCKTHATAVRMIQMVFRCSSGNPVAGRQRETRVLTDRSGIYWLIVGIDVLFSYIFVYAEKYPKIQLE